ncbi:RNA ligase family protein [Streptomyces sp. 1331.2]|uniref:RNA ligase family protein n=1 Tax=Streptomyces sp. 1331.2 TaxID=1938835 RepID=UPI000BD22067|nr:RNA ligase family protein [Streptomyces sp. 1331.2]SOB86183.1 Predicted kinase [Streptomyces sp. 1331.2]
MRVHYPRTPHLPWSPGAAADDVRTGDLTALAGTEVVVTEKLDGENTTLYRDGLHARSLDSAHHPSRAWVKGLQGRIGGRIPDGWRICGENLFARHSIPYTDLESWFYGFSVWTDRDHCLDWDDTVRFLRRLGVPAPRVLWRGRYDERALRALRSDLDLDRQEGYVVRTVRGFPRAEFGERVAKWVRPQHVRTDTHWMHAAVVENELGPNAALWSVRSGALPELPALAAALGLPELSCPPTESAEALVEEVAEVAARLDELGRGGDARLAGVLATALRTERRPSLAARLAGPLGLPLARRVADLVGLHPGLHQPYPDEDRRAGLVRLSCAADLGVLHAVAAATAPGRAEREQVAWSALHAEDAGLLDDSPQAPLARLRSGLREVLADLDRDAADRCWAQAREAYALGRTSTAEEAVAATWRLRDGRFPRLVHLSGPSGSGKSTFAAGLGGVGARISLDDLRAARGSRADQRDNAVVLREGLARLDAALAGAGGSGPDGSGVGGTGYGGTGSGGTGSGGTGRPVVVWDATSLNRQQRSQVHAVAQRRDALITQVVLVVDEDELLRRNVVRPHPVPADVLRAQLHRFSPPYPGQAHRTWYVGAGGTVEDTAGTLDAEED